MPDAERKITVAAGAWRHLSGPYAAFLVQHRRQLAFGTVLMTLSSFGQTYFVALSGPQFRSTFGLSDGGLGAAYALGTIVSALTLSWVGRWIDRTTVTRYTLGVAALLSVACLVTALSPTVAMLVLGFYLLRLGGQGLMTHTALTATARAFPRAVGQAVGIITLGLSLGQAILPLLAVGLIDAIGWRWAWVCNAVVVAFGAVVALRVLPPAARNIGSTRTFDLADALRVALWRDRRLWLALPVLLASPFIATGFFFHQARLAEEKAWDLTWVAGWFSAYAVTQAAVQLAAGPLIDRIGPGRLLPFVLLPQGAAMLTLSLTAAAWGTPVYLILTGVSSAVAATLGTALWVEFYGPLELARVRSAVTAGTVIASGASPILMGLLIDRGIPLSTQAAGCCAYIILASLIATRI